MTNQSSGQELDPGQLNRAERAMELRPILDPEVRERRRQLDKRLWADIEPLEVPPKNAEGWIPRGLESDVNAAVDQISRNVEAIDEMNTFKIVMDYNTADSFSEQFVRHRAMVNYLAKVGLRNAYYNAQEIKITGFDELSDETLRKAFAGSWVVKIGYLPKSVSPKKNILLTARYRPGEGFQEHRYSLAGYWHRERSRF